MADEIANPTTTPVASTDAPAIEVTSSPAPAVTESPAAEPVTTPEPAVTETAPEAAKAETLLGAEKPIEVKAEEAKPEEKPAEAPAEIQVEEKPAEEVVIPAFEPFTLPEGVTLDSNQLTDFAKTLGEFETKSKASHDEVQALGQKMLDRYIEETTRYTESLTQAWYKQADDWKKSTLEDPEIGGNRRETVLKNAGKAIGEFAGTKEQADQFFDMIETTKVGNHPAQIRLINNMMNEITRLRTAYESESEIRQLAAPQIASGQRLSKVQKMYGKK